jgi:hypothetical protein
MSEADDCTLPVYVGDLAAQSACSKASIVLCAWESRMSKICIRTMAGGESSSGG